MCKTWSQWVVNYENSCKYGRVMTNGTRNATVCIEPSDVLCNAFSLTRSLSLSRIHLLPCSRSVQPATMFWGILGYMFVRHFRFLFGFPKTDKQPICPTSHCGYSSPCVHLCCILICVPFFFFLNQFIFWDTSQRLRLVAVHK